MKKMPLSKSSTILEQLSANIDRILAQRPESAGSRPQGKETFEAIIRSAREIYIDEGHAGLTLGKVSKSSGLAKGNIAYYFATKQDLLRSVLLEELGGYLKSQLEQACNSDNKGFDLLIQTVDFYFAETRRNPKFFLQTWSYAVSDLAAKDLIQEMYGIILELLLELTLAANPKLSKNEAKVAALQIMMQVEGITSLHGLELLNDRMFSKLQNLAMKRIGAIIENSQ